MDLLSHARGDDIDPLPMRGGRTREHRTSETETRWRTSPDHDLCFCQSGQGQECVQP